MTKDEENAQLRRDLEAMTKDRDEVVNTSKVARLALHVTDQALSAAHARIADLEAKDANAQKIGREFNAAVAKRLTEDNARAERYRDALEEIASGSGQCHPYRHGYGCHLECRDFALRALSGSPAEAPPDDFASRYQEAHDVVRAATIEECAKVAEDSVRREHGILICSLTPYEIAAAIRALAAPPVVETRRSGEGEKYAAPTTVGADARIEALVTCTWCGHVLTGGALHSCPDIRPKGKEPKK